MLLILPTSLFPYSLLGHKGLFGFLHVPVQRDSFIGVDCERVLSTNQSVWAKGGPRCNQANNCGLANARPLLKMVFYKVVFVTRMLTVSKLFLWLSKCSLSRIRRLITSAGVWTSNELLKMHKESVALTTDGLDEKKLEEREGVQRLKRGIMIKEQK